MPKGLPFVLEDYLQLVDLTGHCIREDKRGYIEDALPDILTRLNISPDNWLTLTTQFEVYFNGAVGSPDAISKYCLNQKLKQRHNISNSKVLLDIA